MHGMDFALGSFINLSVHLSLILNLYLLHIPFPPCAHLSSPSTFPLSLEEQKRGSNERKFFPFPPYYFPSSPSPPLPPLLREEGGREKRRGREKRGGRGGGREGRGGELSPPPPSILASSPPRSHHIIKHEPTPQNVYEISLPTSP